MSSAAAHLLANFEATPTHGEIRAQRGTIFRPAGPAASSAPESNARAATSNNVAEHNSSTSSISFTFFRLPALKLSCISFSYPRPLFSIVCGLFYENTGGGIPLPALHGSHKTSHKSRLSPDFHESQVTSHASVSPLDSALTETPSVTPLESALTKTPRGWRPPLDHPWQRGGD